MYKNNYEFMIEMCPLMSENQVKKSLSCVASPHLPWLGVRALHDKPLGWLVIKNVLP